jgi:class 3 adenylate cyclase
MSDSHQELVDRLSMSEIVRLQDALSQALVRRFQRRLALVFTDIVGSTPYFVTFGDEAGRKLQQRHVDLVQRATLAARGRVVDTAGDGAFLCFPEVDDALTATIEVQKSVAVDNDSRSADERLTVRMGCHWGLVLTDEVQVSGDAVNFCSRIAGSANAGEIRLSRDALQGLNDTRLRLKCRRLPAVTLKGIDPPTELLTLDWHDRAIFPARVRFEDGTVLPLPSQDIVRFGRLEELDGVRVNDIVLNIMDPSHRNRVSRWHFELHRGLAGFMLRSVSEAPTEVDGQRVSKGEEAAVRQGTHVRVGGVLTLEFLGAPTSEETDQRTMLGS